MKGSPLSSFRSKPTPEGYYRLEVFYQMQWRRVAYALRGSSPYGRIFAIRLLLRPAASLVAGFPKIRPGEARQWSRAKSPSEEVGTRRQPSLYKSLVSVHADVLGDRDGGTTAAKWKARVT